MYDVRIKEMAWGTWRPSFGEATVKYAFRGTVSMTTNADLQWPFASGKEQWSQRALVGH